MHGPTTGGGGGHAVAGLDPPGTDGWDADATAHLLSLRTFITTKIGGGVLC